MNTAYIVRDQMSNTLNRDLLKMKLYFWFHLLDGIQPYQLETMF